MFKYLHEPTTGTIVLDHRLTPEVRAMLAAMVSRSPIGGMKQRYSEVVEAVAESSWNSMNPRHPWVDMVKLVEQSGDLYEVLFRDEDDSFLDVTRRSLAADLSKHRERAEEALTTYPLHPKVQGFFDQFVGAYGHSSILELTGSPTVGVEGISWFTAWLLFDSPLVAGQEFSTRAVRHKNWPMARECLTGDRKHTPVDLGASGVAHFYLEQPDADLKALHEAWLEVYEAEVAWWQKHLSDPENRAALGIGDKEPFRPALDRARWALPGTFATGAAFASHLRERARVIRDAQSINKTPTPVWADIEAAYRQAAPGLAQYGLREAVVGGTRDLPGHLASILRPVEALAEPSGVSVRLQTVPVDAEVRPYARSQERSYLDPWFNNLARASVQIECSLAVARDWHRHRTLYPWHLGVVLSEGLISIDRRYEPKSELGRSKLPELLRRSTELYQRFLAAGDVERAALALPLGTKVVVFASGGLRDVVYMLELRAHAHGANFEYKEQAEAALHHLEIRMRLAFMSFDSEESLYSGSGFHPEVRGR
jgi:thymidylate synthase ThyX